MTPNVFVSNRRVYCPSLVKPQAVKEVEVCTRVTLYTRELRALDGAILDAVRLKSRVEFDKRGQMSSTLLRSSWMYTFSNSSLR